MGKALCGGLTVDWNVTNKSNRYAIGRHIGKKLYDIHIFAKKKDWPNPL